MKKLKLLFIIFVILIMLMPLAFPVSGQGRISRTTLTALSEELNELLTQYPVTSFQQRATIRPPFGGRSTSRPVSTPIPTRRPSSTPRPTRTVSAITVVGETPSASVFGSTNNYQNNPSADNPLLNTTSTLLLNLRYILLYWAIGFGIVFALSWILNRYTLSHVSLALRNAELKPSLAESLLGLLYRLVIFLLVVFFYASFAIMAAWVLVGGIHLLIVFSAGLFAFLLIAFFVFGAFYRYGRVFYYGLFASPPIFEGRRLSRSQAPELWKIIEDVAYELGTPPINHVYITPNTQISVWESGSMLSVIFGYGERNLKIGLDSLNTLSMQQLKAVLAHEYSHFSNGDTSFGGFLSLRVYYAMQRTRSWLIAQQQNQNWNIIWLFLRFFQPMFIRVTLGASQMQEVIADRNAARQYGSQAMSDGLMNLTHQAVRFDTIANIEINNALKENRPIPNLYQVETTEEIEENVKKIVSQIIFIPAGTHPPTIVRVAFFKKFEENNPYNKKIDDASANQLILNLDELQKEMMTFIERDVTNQLLLMKYIHQAQQQGRLKSRRQY